MDLDLLIAIILAVFLICFAIEHDDGFMLFMLGFINLAIVFNLDSLFSINPSSYNNFGSLFQLIYAFIAIFCFAKIIMSANQEGLLNFMKRHHDRK